MLLINALPRDRFRHLIVLHRPGILADYLDERKIPYTYLDSVKPVGAGGLVSQCINMLFVSPYLVKFIRKHEIDIIHTNDMRMHLTWAFAARIISCKHIWHQRGADNSRRLSLFSSLVSSVLTISHYCKSSLSHGIATRAKVIYNPFDTMAAVPARDKSAVMVRQECGLAEVDYIVGFIGNLTDQKRPLDFIDAAVKLKQQLGDCVGFVMFGETRSGIYEAVKERINHCGMENRIVLMGPKHPIEPWLAGFDVLLAPAINEGLGRTLVEAALVGTPVVAADDGGHREIIKDGQTGYLVRPKDIGVMADRVASLLVDPSQKRHITRRLIKDVRARFSIENHVRSIISIYEDLTL